MSFPLCLLVFAIIALVAWGIGYRGGFSAGADAGFDEGYDFAADDSEVRWRLTATGGAALDAPRQPLAELTLHDSLLPGVSYKHQTRTFEKP